MIRIPLTALLGLALVSFGSAAWSMDLLQAYELAQVEDATLQAARSAALAGRERLPQARSQFFPNVSANFSYNRNDLASTTPDFLGRDQTTNNKYPSSNQSLTLRQPIYRSHLMAQYRQAQAQVDETEATLAQEEQSLTARVSSAYFEALLAHDQLDLVLAQRATYTTQLDLARKTLAAGSGTRTDIDESQARLDMNTALEIEARQHITYTEQQLQALINQPVGQLAKLKVASLDLSDPQPNRLEDWVERAERSSPQLQALRAQIEVAREEVGKAKAGHLPVLDAIAQLSRSKSESVTSTASSHNNTSIGLQLNVPLFAGGYVNSQVRQALAGQTRAEQAYEAGRRDLGVRVYKEYRGVTEGVPKIKALEQALRSSDQLVLSSRKSFQAGSRTVLDVLNAEQQRVFVLRDLAQARYMYLNSRVRLLSLVGGADLEAVQAINRYLQP